jgi:hypothetical protein
MSKIKTLNTPSGVIQIDVAYPIPTGVGGKYAWSIDMEVGDSFLTEDHLLMVKIVSWCKRNGHKEQFISRKEEGKIRIWKTKKENT